MSKQIPFYIFIILISFQAKAQTYWSKVSAGTEYSIALRSDGTLWSWGSNLNGELGSAGPLVFIPVQIGTDYDWADISCGAFHVLALKQDGTLWGWGSNQVGQVSVVQLQQIFTPTQIGTIS